MSGGAVVDLHVVVNIVDEVLVVEEFSLDLSWKCLDFGPFCRGPLARFIRVFVFCSLRIDLGLTGRIASGGGWSDIGWC